MCIGRSLSILQGSSHLICPWGNLELQAFHIEIGLAWSASLKNQTMSPSMVYVSVSFLLLVEV